MIAAKRSKLPLAPRLTYNLCASSTKYYECIDIGYEILDHCRVLRFFRIAIVLLAFSAGCTPPTAPPTATPTTTPTPSDTPTPTATYTPSPTPTPTFPVDALVEESALNLRAGPNTRHPIHGVVRPGTPMAIEGRDDVGHWYSIRLPGDERGWVSADFVTLRRDYETIPTAQTPTPPPTLTPTAVPMDAGLSLIAEPPQVAQGDPFFVRLRAPDARQVVVLFDSLEVHLQPYGDGIFGGFLGADLMTNPGSQMVFVTIVDGGGNTRNEQIPITIHSGGYPDEIITLSEERMQLLDPAQDEAETAGLMEIWRQVSPEKLWQGQWISPVTGTMSSPFGSFRNYNQDRYRSRHTGMDLRGGVGSPVFAPARGRVSFASPLAVRGNCIWMDHGWGLHTGYFHLSSMQVEVGQIVERGTLIGLVGMTGRTTAPHLHWEARLHGRPIHPIQFLLRDIGFVR